MCVCNWLKSDRRQTGRHAVEPMRQDSADWAILYLHWTQSAHTHTQTSQFCCTHTNTMDIKIYSTHPTHWSMEEEGKCLRGKQKGRDKQRDLDVKISLKATVLTWDGDAEVTSLFVYTSLSISSSDTATILNLQYTSWFEGEVKVCYSTVRIKKGPQVSWGDETYVKVELMWLNSLYTSDKSEKNGKNEVTVSGVAC